MDWLPEVGDRVRVVGITDETGLQEYIGRDGEVDHLDYDCGCGQTYPGDPMIGVNFDNGDGEEFWKEELTPV